MNNYKWVFGFTHFEAGSNSASNDQNLLLSYRGDFRLTVGINYRDGEA